MATKPVGRPKKKPLSQELYTRKTSWDATAMIGMLPDPDRILEKLGEDRETAYRDIETDDQITAVRAKRTGKLLAYDWDIAQDKASAQATKEVKEIFNDLDMRQFSRDVTRALGWGISPIECVWNTAGRFWVPEKLVQLPPRWFEYNDENELRFLSTSHSIDGDPIPPRKLLLPVHDSDFDNPYGVSLLSRCYWAATFKRNAIAWWNQGLEKFAIPFLYATVPQNTGEEEKSKILTFLGNMIQNGVGVMPKDSEIQALDAKSKQSSDLFDKFVYGMDKSIAKVWLGGTLTTDSGDVGSYALGKTHETGEDALVESDAHMVMNIANKLIDWIMYYNFTGPSPKFIMNPPFKADNELATRDKTLSETGVKFKKSYYMEHHNLKEEDFDIAEEKEAPVMPENPKDDLEDFSFSSSFKDEITKFKDQKALDIALNSIEPAKLQAQAEGMLKPIIELINNSESYEQARDGLLAQWPKMDMKAIEEVMLQAIFASEAIGRIGATEEK